MTTTRILIAGGPRTGKTTKANELGAQFSIPVRHTDDLIATHDWSAASAEVATWMSEVGAWIIEGVAVGRALRKWYAANPEGDPFTEVYYLTGAFEPLSKGQTSMAKGCDTVWAEVAREMLRRKSTMGAT